MSKKKMSTIIVFGFAFLLIYLAWKNFTRQGYESAEYSVVESAGAFEIRKYPDLVLVKTKMKPSSQGDDGGFMKLFGYISGENEAEEKIAMTTPVFMEQPSENSAGSMGFVMPSSQADSVPKPTNEDVRVGRREGGLFAVYRFAGEMDDASLASAEQKLREWIKSKDLRPVGNAERAGYDPPFTPGFLRRNEILVRLEQK